MPLRISWPVWGQRRTDRALTRAGDLLLDDADSRVPTDGGELKASGRVELIDAQTVRVSFNTPYAVRQHYLKRYRHKGGGEMLFLLNATEAVGPAVQQVLADEIRRALKNR